MAVLGLRFCARTFSSCGERGPLFIAVRGPLTIAASPVAEHRLQTCRLSNCGSRAQLLRGMWDLPRPGLEPLSPALAGRFSTTAPPGKPNSCLLKLPGELKQQFKRLPGMAGTSKGGQSGKHFLVKPQMYQPTSLYNEYCYRTWCWKLNLGQWGKIKCS